MKKNIYILFQNHFADTLNWSILQFLKKVSLYQLIWCSKISIQNKKILKSLFSLQSPVFTQVLCYLIALIDQFSESKEVITLKFLLLFLLCKDGNGASPSFLHVKAETRGLPYIFLAMLYTSGILEIKFLYFFINGEYR